MPIRLLWEANVLWVTPFSIIELQTTNQLKRKFQDSNSIVEIRKLSKSLVYYGKKRRDFPFLKWMTAKFVNLFVLNVGGA